MTNEDADWWFGCNGCAVWSQPTIEPRNHFWDEIDIWARVRMSRRTVTPWSDQQRFFALQRFECSKGVISVSICPTSNDHRGALNAFIARSKRTVSPIWTVVLLLKPGKNPRLNFIQTHLPLRFPVVAKQRWHGWEQIACRHVMAIVNKVDRA